MSNTNPPSKQPTPLETEAYLESSPLTIDVSVNTGQEDVPSNDTQLATTDGFLIARKLRQHNRELVKTVVQLEQALAESQAKLQSQITRSRSADSMITQQADHLGDRQDEISHITQELGKAKQDAKEYKVLMAELNKKFQTSQTQFAQIERECSLLQESYNEQQQKLFAAEQEIQDLQTRLQRQQRYTLEYKSALNQQANLPEEPEIQTSTSPLPKVSRIQPWSEQPKPPVTKISTISTEIAPLFTEKNPEESPVYEETSLVMPPDINEDLEQQLNLLEMEIEEMAQETVEVPEPQPAPVNIARPSTLQFPPIPKTTTTSTVQLGRTTQAPRVPVAMGRGQAATMTPQQNWPSPTLSSVRSPKKLSSLAAVDLPSFSRR